MLSRDNRLPRIPFDEVFKAGKRLSSAAFMLQFAPAGDGSLRFGVVVSKKTAKTAVARNRVRRRAFSALADLLPGMNPGFHAVFYAKAGSALLPQAAIGKEFSELLHRAHLMR